MKKLIITASFIIGLSAVGFGQTEKVEGEGRAIVDLAHSGRSEMILHNDLTGEVYEIVLQNDNVAVVPGESVHVHVRDMDIVITTGNGQVYLGIPNLLDARKTANESSK